MPDDTDPPQTKQFKMINGERVLEWTPFQPADLPKFDVVQFLSKKETSAHYELDQQKDVLRKFLLLTLSPGTTLKKLYFSGKNENILSC